MKLYVAGPMRGIPGFNFPEFDAASNALEGREHSTFSPADNDRQNGFEPAGMTGNEDLSRLGFDLRAALAEDTRVIAEWADAVAVLSGWEKSSGARAEVALAHALGLPVAHWQDIVLYAPAGGPAHMIPARFLINADTPPSGTLQDAPASASGEIRSVSSTGAEKGTKPERFDLLPVEALAAVARHYGVGARKYSAHNWRKGYEWSKSYAALQRHLHAFWSGEDTDEETGSPHMAAVAFHALTLLTFMQEQPQFDDRYKAQEDAA